MSLVDVKDVEVDESNQITNLNGIVIGYKIENINMKCFLQNNKTKLKI